MLNCLCYSGRVGHLVVILTSLWESRTLSCHVNQLMQEWEGRTFSYNVNQFVGEWDGQRLSCHVNHFVSGSET